MPLTDHVALFVDSSKMYLCDFSGKILFSEDMFGGDAIYPEYPQASSPQLLDGEFFLSSSRHLLRFDGL